MDWRESAKKRAAVKAIEQVVNGFVIGLGSGTTVNYALQEIGKRISTFKLNIIGVPTSHATLLQAVESHIPLTTLNEHPKLDLAIDGADQIDSQLNMIKGRGGAMTREKIVASVSKKNVIVVDETKMTNQLGMNQPVPVEVLPFALFAVKTKLEDLGGNPVLREAEKKLGPVMTDNGNFILDVHFGYIGNPKKLDRTLKIIPGVVETGLFVDFANVVYVGGRKGVKTLEN